MLLQAEHEPSPFLPAPPDESSSRSDISPKRDPGLLVRQLLDLPRGKYARSVTRMPVREPVYGPERDKPCGVEAALVLADEAHRPTLVTRLACAGGKRPKQRSAKCRGKRGDWGKCQIGHDLLLGWSSIPPGGSNHLPKSLPFEHPDPRRSVGQAAQLPFLTGIEPRGAPVTSLAQASVRAVELSTR